MQSKKNNRDDADQGPLMGLRIERAIAQMTSLREGEQGVVAAIACGPAAIPALRALLFRREPSGLYQPRRWAVEALAALGAYEVLRDYLSRRQEVTGPVERMGDEAVANAAARALAGLREEWVFQLLLALARRHPTAGVIDALATFDRTEAIPFLIDALAEDDCRPVAETGLKNLRAAAQPALLVTAITRPTAGTESETSLRRRRSAMRLLTETTLSPEACSLVRHLLADPDPRVAVLACKLCLMHGPECWQPRAVARLANLLPLVDWITAREIEGVLSDAARTRYRP